MMVQLFQSAEARVDEKTHLLITLTRAAPGSVRTGQIWAKLSYVRLPISIASLASTWPRPSFMYASSDSRATRTGLRKPGQEGEACIRPALALGRIPFLFVCTHSLRQRIASKLTGLSLAGALRPTIFCSIESLNQVKADSRVVRREVDLIQHARLAQQPGSRSCGVP